ncbi:sigma factor-like helix-turn-helix DNA-binding protein [Streptomyces sp. HPF1205]|uniref:sigma factor-like helix-turn-helix DNA-binding protein n=1 Tax=Streptomyces sp. HPF1205 TaxID=2873262 RepID=UPI001CED49D4|nr:sigma factor-like helix-turn-helix DNA-binding protein [Streptomyces sp. HPF1205]
MDGLRGNEPTGTETAARHVASADGPETGPLPPAAEDRAAEAMRVRLFGAAYRMLGSACEAEAIVSTLLAPGDRRGKDGGGGADGPSGARLVGEVVGEAIRRAETASRGRREGHAVAWLPEPVLTGAGALGRMDTPGARESVSMARLVVLERVSPAERAAFVLREQFGYGPADASAVLGLPEERCRSLLRRSRQRVRESETPARTEAGGEQRRQAVEELLRAVLDEDRAAVEELLADDVVAWSDGGWEPGAVRRPVLGAVKVGRFLTGLRARAPEGITGTVAEVNGDAAVVGTARGEVVGVLAPEFGERGMVGIRTVANPARLAYLTRQWVARAPR